MATTAPGQSESSTTAAPRRIRPLTIVIPLLTLAVVALIIFSNRATGPANGARPIAQLQATDFHALAFSQNDPKTVFFGSHDGVLVSRDQGETWQPTSLQGVDAMALTTSAQNPQRLYASGHGIFYRSNDGGATWDKVNSRIQGADIHGFAASPDNADQVYALVVGQGLMTSADGGTTWQPLSPDMATDFVSAMVAGTNQTLYLGNSVGSVFESRDGGQTWQQSSLGIGAQITNMTFDQRSGDLFAASVAPQPGAGMMRMISRRAAGSTSWEMMMSFPGTQPAIAVSISPSDKTMLLLNQGGELYRSRDGGRTWGR